MLTFRIATIEDCELYHSWANDALVRSQSYNTGAIDLDTHTKWFNERVTNPDFYFFIFQNQAQENIGQVRITKDKDNTAIIGVSIDSMHRGKGYATQILNMASESFLTENPAYTVYAYIKQSNVASIHSFIKANFVFEKKLIYQDQPSVLYIKTIQQCK
jgi:RimJ/RimL family protein N-acetyltransferase